MLLTRPNASHQPREARTSAGWPRHASIDLRIWLHYPSRELDAERLGHVDTVSKLGVAPGASAS